MIFHRFYDTHLAQASYLVGCAARGEAIVIDPNRDVEPYLRVAADEGLHITAVTETHIHADYVSGARELAVRAGATLYLSDEGDADWKYAFAGEAGAVLLRDGATMSVGNIHLRAVHTPGHTPEHLSFLLTDGAAADEPMGIFTGDFVFVGDVGRPDLLEKAAGVVGTMEAGARTLFRSLQWFRSLPDYLQIWPGHGAGSACGKGLSAVPQSTVGYERLTNWGLAIDDEAEFVRAVLAGQPEPPAYFAQMKRINKLGPRLLATILRPARLTPADVTTMLERGETVVDTRPAADFARGHLPGTISIPLDRSFTTWAGWLLPYDRPFALLLDERDDAALATATSELARIGLDGLTGYAGLAVLDAWSASGRALATTTTLAPSAAAALVQRGEADVLDVRGRTEWEAGRLPGAPNVPLGWLSGRLTDLPQRRPLIVYCQSGARSAIAASLLQALGIDEVMDLAGGLNAWRAAGLPIEPAAAVPAAA